MPRTRQYDVAKVRAGFVRAFHERGYGQTSLADLEHYSGLNRRQIYNDFGDKREVFLAAIDDFMALAGERFLGALEDSMDGLPAIEKTLRAMLSVADSEQGRLGCLMCNTAREPINDDPQIGARVSSYFARIERSYLSALQRAIAAGELNQPNESLPSLAQFYLAIHISICVLGKAGEPPSMLANIVSQALQHLR